MAGMIEYNVTLDGRRPVIFDRYPGDNKTKLPAEEKFYFVEETNQLCFPALNLYSMICAQNGYSAAKLHFDSRIFKRIAFILSGAFAIDPMQLPFTRNGKPILFDGFGKNGISITRAAPRLKNGVPNPTERPMLSEPWSLSFRLKFMPFGDCSEATWRQLWDVAGALVGIGTYRGPYGKFEVIKWERIKT